jgi:hypothetical protein
MFPVVTFSYRARHAAPPRELAEGVIGGMSNRDAPSSLVCAAARLRPASENNETGTMTKQEMLAAPERSC